ncbi:serine--tRNA ligase, chloroplastic/mitochondrial [Diachasma alloeum]|uniref:serine--tRNA ligase, chloroplastic/mitochondrial n=1 Tax=Diachasma alloeum TaxID=454923 RepID=UPI00073837BC|nr:serine--tRNA ligase, chloroplastic/mitochondrial [Diachasma alloeum]XP_015119123.1 serine--tRNA ligase, chloroplastic/mitochondrial [Diachasma alloeum]
MAFKRNLMHFVRNRKEPRIISSSKLSIPETNFNTDLLCDSKNREAIAMNIKCRKGIGDVDKILQLSTNNSTVDKMERTIELAKELNKIPNFTFPKVLEYGNEGKIIKECTKYSTRHDFKQKTFIELAKSLKLLRMEDLGPIAGDKSYILLGDVAQLEEALIQYSIRRLMHNGFKLISVPDVLPTQVIEKCGMIVDGERTLIYSLDDLYGDDLSLSGTAEMALATKLINSNIDFENNLPLKLAAVSRCFRAEISNSAEEQGIYRVHQFTKVEMFACTKECESDNIFKELTEIQERLFTELELPFKIIDMPSHDLGAPAYRKFDIEGWLPGREAFGELSSCSNCTDYQSRRLNIKYRTVNGESKYVHTLNGTACAIPRTIIAICENFQTKDGKIQIPEKLVPFMNGKNVIEKQKIADMRDYKYKCN